jgi:hypothetical protein
MKVRNDYAKKVRTYLDQYNLFQTAIKNLQEEAAAQQARLSDYKLSITKYGDEPIVSGGLQVSQTENAVEQRIKIEEKIKRINLDIASLECIVNKLDRAIDGLPSEEHDLIVGYFLEGRTWQMIAQKLYISEKWAREKSGKAIKEIAFMMFGSVALL